MLQPLFTKVPSIEISNTSHVRNAWQERLFALERKIRGFQEIAAEGLMAPGN
jgi:hypothetical protein